MEYSDLPLRIRAVERTIAKATETLNILGSFKNPDNTVVKIRVCNSNGDEFEVCCADLMEFIYGQNRKNQTELTKLERIHETLSDVAKGLFNK